MKLLLDENLSPRLILQISATYPSSTHCRDCGLMGKTDYEVWHYAAAHDFVLVSKDNDFRQLAVLKGAPPKVIYLRLGNCTTSEVRDLLLSSIPSISVFLKDQEASLLILEPRATNNFT